jgi:polysaccharide biosynthesis transport protein
MHTMNSTSHESPRKSEITIPPFTVSTVLNAVRCWWKVMTPIALLLAAGAGAAVFYFHKPSYTAKASLLILERPNVILRDVNTDSKRFIQNQKQFLLSKTVLGSLAQKPGVLAAPELAGEEDVLAALARRITFVQSEQSDIYNVSYRGETAEKAEFILNEVLTSYLSFYSKNEAKQSNLIIERLTEQLAIRAQQVGQLRENVLALSLELTGVDPFSDIKDPEASQQTNPMARLQGDITNLEIDRDLLAMEIKAEEETQALEMVEIPVDEVEMEVLKHSRYLALREKIERTRQRQGDFQKTGKNLESNSPDYRALLADLAADLKALDALKISLGKEIKETMAQNIATARRDNLNSLKRELNVSDTRLKILKDKFEQGVTSAKKLKGGNLDLEIRKAKLEQVTKIHDELSARILAINTEFSAPQRVELFSPVSRPLRPDAIIPWRNIGVGSGLAFFAPFSLVVVWEHLFRRVTSRLHLEEANQLNVIGEVTALPARRRGSFLGKRSAERDLLLYEESVDGLRTYLSLVEPLRGLRVLAVTSAVSREGKTSLAAQLASSIARATGEPTLLIDGDMRSPDIHNVFNFDLSPGLADVLVDECPLREAIETGFSEHLHILTAGAISVTPHRLLSNGEFDKLLDEAVTMYRHIVIDTPPVLSASEALVLASAAEAAVLCVRRDFSRVDQVREASRRMMAAGVKTAGAVINGIPLRHYAYKYGSYLYNRVAGSASA